MELAVSELAGEATNAAGAAVEIRKLRHKALQRRVTELRSGPMNPEQLQEYSRLMSELKSSAQDL